MVVSLTLKALLRADGCLIILEDVWHLLAVDLTDPHNVVVDHEVANLVEEVDDTTVIIWNVGNTWRYKVW